MSNPKFRASYSYLKLWTEGRWEEAIKAYFKLDRFISRAMAEGSDYHNEWEAYINKHKALPPELGGLKLNNPICEEKLVIPMYDWLDLVVKLDCYDSPIVHEFKTGSLESSDYARTYQPAVYAVGMVLLNRPVQFVDIHHYNQYTKNRTYSRIVVTEKLLADAVNWIEAVGSEMHAYFVENDLYTKFANPPKTV